jgi:(1->4)-alpha-D-glucan 1-alpha-D-glucosylmutase
MVTTTTHDTKRGEDTRIRIDAVSQVVELWTDETRRWRSATRSSRRRVRGAMAPDANDQYLIFQTLVGVMPENGVATEELGQRVLDYVTKALREAKRHSGWANPNEAYENATHSYLRDVLDQLSQSDDEAGEFAVSFRRFLRVLVPIARRASLSQAVVRLTVPGVPDTYRGSELFEMSLVDPDNRRPVDYRLRAEALSKVAEVTNRGLELADSEDAEVEIDWSRLSVDEQKLAITSLLLQLRRRHPELLVAGRYTPLGTSESSGEAIIAYARTSEDEALIVVARRIFARGDTGDSSDSPAAGLEGAAVVLPYELSNSTYVDVLTGSVTRDVDGRLELASLLTQLPVAILRRRPS